MRKLIWLLLLLIISVLLDMSSAQEVQTLGTFQTQNCLNLKQTCDNCSFINVSVSIPPNQSTIIYNQSMVRQSRNLWTYFFCNTTNNGEYIYDTYGDLNGDIKTGSVNFYVNPVGKQLSSAQATLYFMILAIAFVLFLGCFIFGLYAPGGNERDAMTGYVLAVSNMKYVKMFMVAMSYLLLMLIVYFAYIISYGYLDLDFLGNLFRIAFTTMVVLIIPLFIICVYVVIANKIRDSKLSDMLSRGLRVR